MWSSDISLYTGRRVTIDPNPSLAFPLYPGRTDSSVFVMKNPAVPQSSYRVVFPSVTLTGLWICEAGHTLVLRDGCHCREGCFK